MRRGSISDTHARKRRVYQLVCKYPDGIKEAEIERILAIQRRTLNNYLRQLESEGKIFKDGIYWLPDETKPIVLREMPLEPEEVMVLYSNP